MIDIIFESIRAGITLLIVVYLWLMTRTGEVHEQKGWRFIVSGFAIVLFGMLIDITDNFSILDRYVIIGDTPYQAFLEKVVGGLFGFALIAIGFWKWVPVVNIVASTRRQLSKLNNELETRIEDRTAELLHLNETLLRENTERKRVEEALIKSEERLDLAMSVANDGIWDWRLDNNTILFDSRYYTMSGYEPNEFPCEIDEWKKRIHPNDIQQTMFTVEQYLAGNREDFNIEFRFLRKGGDYMWILGRGKIVARDDNGSPQRFVGTHSDITHSKQQEEQILHQAHFDALTNLPNRFLSLDRLSQLLNESQRSNELVAVLFLDMDDFKKINDTLGHDTGDKLLIEASERLKGAVRKGDTVGRLGGDEFIILLGSLADAVDARPVVENLLEQFRNAFKIDGRELILTASVGIAVFPDDGNNSSELLRNADSAMYHSKELGRNTYSYFTEAMNREVSRRLALEVQIHSALERGEFEVFYQSQVDLSSGKIIGAEALLRWHNPALGEVSPAEFIPIAEQTGLIVSLGQFVLTEALAMTVRWQQDYEPKFRIAVNLSPLQFRDPCLVSFIEEIMDQLGVSGESLELEITEGVLMTGHAYIDDALAALSSLNVSIAMDDFGTGYSSLSYLRNYPFDVLKIDRSFVNDITVDPADRELINATIVMAHRLSLNVVAEGVETEEQLAYLKELGCNYAQGYLFSKPVPKEEMTEALSSEYVELCDTKAIEFLSR